MGVRSNGGWRVLQRSVDLRIRSRRVTEESRPQHAGEYDGAEYVTPRQRAAHSSILSFYQVRLSYLDIDFVHPEPISPLDLVFLLDIPTYEQIPNIGDPGPLLWRQSDVASHLQSPSQFRHWGSVQAGLLMVPF